MSECRKVNNAMCTVAAVSHVFLKKCSPQDVRLVEESPDVLLNVFASEMEREGVEGLEMDETKFSCHHAPSLPVIQDDETSHGYLNAHFDGMEELGEVNQSLETRSNSEDSTSTLELEEDIECCEIPGYFVSSETDMIPKLNRKELTTPNFD
jgi:hypothetical protein